MVFHGIGAQGGFKVNRYCKTVQRYPLKIHCPYSWFLGSYIGSYEKPVAEAGSVSTDGALLARAMQQEIDSLHKSPRTQEENNEGRHHSRP